MSFDPYLLRCTACGQQLDERRVTVWSKVEGWEKKRDQGGTNAVAIRKPLGEFMCEGCMALAKSGLSTDQLTLGA